MLQTHQQSVLYRYFDEDPVDETEPTFFGTPFTDLLIHFEVMLPREEEIQSGKVEGRKKKRNENLIGNIMRTAS